MAEIESSIVGNEKVTNIFGYWPSFHDAEVMELNFWRGDVNPDVGKYVFPLLVVKLHLWETTNDLDGRGYYGLRKHTLVTLRFHEFEEFRMEGFNHQNAILGLDITEEHRTEGATPVLRVHFRSAFGMDASFVCSRAEVVEALPCTTEGAVARESESASLD